MFMGPLEQVKPWQTSGIQGCRRFLDRVDAVASRPLNESELSEETAKLLHRTIKKVGEDIEGMRFNTAISQMMTLANHLNGFDNPPREAVEKLLLCLAPFAPHLAEELWDRLGPERDDPAASISHVPWPGYDPKLCVDDEVEMPVQINGKVRGRVTLPRGASDDQARDAALGEAAVAKLVDGKRVVKVIHVPGRIINLIVK
jgi:leucyl-tRNA synthetase